jgi:hypothetical protein
MPERKLAPERACQRGAFAGGQQQLACAGNGETERITGYLERYVSLLESPAMAVGIGHGTDGQLAYRFLAGQQHFSMGARASARLFREKGLGPAAAQTVNTGRMRLDIEPQAGIGQGKLGRHGLGCQEIQGFKLRHVSKISLGRHSAILGQMPKNVQKPLF